MRFLPIVMGLLLAACATHVPDDPAWQTIDMRRLPPADFSADIAGLRPCTSAPDNTLRLNRSEPVVVLTHGCFGSAARFRALAEVFAFHGQQTVCFAYDYRDSLTQSASELTTALRELSKQLDNPRIVVIGHSQGGLVSRKALTEALAEPLWPQRQVHLSLVTISAPFAGIESARHCGSPAWRTYSLGLVGLMCRIISGDKWFEITYASDFIRKPGELMPQVERHLKIVTDERNSCRTYSHGDVCMEDDFVFSVDEQYFEAVDRQKRVEGIEVQAGHAEIVGDYKTPPNKLIAILQKEGVMRQTAPERKAELQVLLSLLY